MFKQGMANQMAREAIKHKTSQVGPINPETVLDQIIAKMGWPSKNKYEQGGAYQVTVTVGENAFDVLVADSAYNFSELE